LFRETTEVKHTRRQHRDAHFEDATLQVGILRPGLEHFFEGLRGHFRRDRATGVRPEPRQAVLDRHCLAARPIFALQSLSVNRGQARVGESRLVIEIEKLQLGGGFVDHKARPEFVPHARTLQVILVVHLIEHGRLDNIRRCEGKFVRVLTSGGAREHRSKLEPRAPADRLDEEEHTAPENC